MVVTGLTTAGGAGLRSATSEVEGGQARLDLGMVLGMGLLVRKGCARMSSREGLLAGSRTRMRLMRFLTLSLMTMWSGY